MNNVNVINNVKEKINVLVNNVNGDIQIVINLKDNDINLLELKPGETFIKNNTEYIVLEQLSDGKTVVIRKYLLDRKSVV